MPRLYLVRHGRATGGFGDDADPGLDDEGKKQAVLAAEALSSVGPIPILVSPLRRARETADALERWWGTAAIVDPGVSEIPSPTDDLAERDAWLRQAMGKTWTELGPRYTSWRTMVTELLLKRREDTVVFTHFIAINVIIGAAQGNDKLMVARVDNGSITTVDHDNNEFSVVTIGGTGLTDETVVQ